VIEALLDSVHHVGNIFRLNNVNSEW